MSNKPSLAFGEPQQPRNYFVGLKLTKCEHDSLVARARLAQLTLSELCRGALFEGEAKGRARESMASRPALSIYEVISTKK